MRFCRSPNFSERFRHLETKANLLLRRQTSPHLDMPSVRLDVCIEQVGSLERLLRFHVVGLLGEGAHFTRYPRLRAALLSNRVIVQTLSLSNPLVPSHSHRRLGCSSPRYKRADCF